MIGMATTHTPTDGPLTSLQRDMLYAVAMGEFGVIEGKIYAACGYVLPAEARALRWLTEQGYATTDDPMALTDTGRKLAERCDFNSAAVSSPSGTVET